MKRRIVVFLLGIALIACSESPKDLDIYLCIGQSNMAGRGPLDASVMDTLRGVYLLAGDSTLIWEKAANPLNKYSSIRKDLSMQKLGPSYSFAKAMADASSGMEIGLVVNAKGGTSIRQWHPDSLFFKEAVRRTRIAMQQGELKGIIWHQGCSDASNWESYLPKLKFMVEQFRTEFDNEALPFIVGQLSEDKASRKAFNAMLLGVPTHIPNAAVVTSENLHTIDNTHFDTQSQIVLGQRYAKEMLLLMKQ